MLRPACALFAAWLLAAPAAAQPAPFPGDFRVQDIPANGATIHVRVGGHGPAVVLLHGFGDTGDMWGPMASELERDHTVVVPDLRGMGLSSKPAGGFDKKTQAGDLAGVLDALKIQRADVVTHDIGNMVGFAFAAQHPDRVTRFVLIDAPVPGVGPWEEILKNPLLWHFRFGGPDMERLVAGRERIYLDRFYNDFGAHPERITEATRDHYARLYALPGAMHSSFAQFAASIRMPSTTAPSWPITASSRCRSWRSAATSRSGTRWPRSCAPPPRMCRAASSQIQATGSWTKIQRRRWPWYAPF